MMDIYVSVKGLIWKNKAKTKQPSTNDAILVFQSWLEQVKFADNLLPQVVF